MTRHESQKQPAPLDSARSVFTNFDDPFTDEAWSGNGPWPPRIPLTSTTSEHVALPTPVSHYIDQIAPYASSPFTQNVDFVAGLRGLNHAFNVAIGDIWQAKILPRVQDEREER
jgi:hypothetical protein